MGPSVEAFPFASSRRETASWRKSKIARRSRVTSGRASSPSGQSGSAYRTTSRIIVPPLTSQYLNLTKNSSLAVAIGFPLARLDPQVAEVGLSFLRENITPERRGDAFGPEVEPPPDAGPYDVLAAFAGRRA